MKEIKRCISCDGYGWQTDDFTGEEETCTWCRGIGYVYRDADGIDQPIPLCDQQSAHISARLEALEIERLREMGYSGEAKQPWQQDIRKGTQGGLNPYDET